LLILSVLALFFSSNPSQNLSCLPENPCRKSLISQQPQLTYLDDRPVFDKEREMVEAWAAGGMEAENAARDSIRQREQDVRRRNFKFMQAIRSEAFRQVQCFVLGIQNLAPEHSCLTQNKLINWLCNDLPSLLCESFREVASFLFLWF
jgi:hypothetical protein